MRIGELAECTGVGAETIRYYEREGLLPAVTRSNANYRIYGREAATRLLFIRHCRALDIKLPEIRHLLRLRDDPEADCGDVNALVDCHLQKVREQKRALARLERQLKALRDQCHDVRQAKHCGILKELSAVEDGGVRWNPCTSEERYERPDQHSLQPRCDDRNSSPLCVRRGGPGSRT